MARKWSEIADATMSPERRARSRARAKAAMAEMHLSDLRRARELSQVELAEKLGIAQSEVSKVEKRADVMLSTLRKYVEAAGGKLELVARFPDRDIKISQFAELAGRHQ